jgi:TonB-linked SusC/RagA family outer membrane protein
MQLTAVFRLFSWTDHYLTHQTLRVMKLSAILLFVISVQVSARTTGQTVTLDLKNAPIQKVLKEASKQTGISIIYNEALFNGFSPVTIKVKNATIQQVLDQCLKDQPFAYSFETNMVVINKKQISVIQSPATNASPPGDIHGLITDSTGVPLEGASVTVKGKKGKGTVTNEKGEFDLKGVDENTTLLVSFTGYVSQEIKLRGNNSINLRLEHSNSELDQVQVIAYGTTTQRLTTGSISTVSSKEIEEQPISNPLEALEGRMPGVYIQQTTGVSGGGFNIQIRGLNSLRQYGSNNGNLPFYIVDGVPFTSTSLDLNTAISSEITPQSSPLNTINPSDIESIEVLKDADATAIYGSRGSNGVVLITTKRGKAGKTKVDINAYSGAGSITRQMNLLNTPQYLEMRHEAFTNDGATPQFYDYDVNGSYDTTRYTNWQKTLIGGMAHVTSIQADLSGGNQNTQFMFGAGYFRQGTVFPGDFADQKGSLHLNLNHSSENKKLITSLFINYAADFSNLPLADPTSFALRLAPNAPALVNPDGTLNWANGSWQYPGNPLAFFRQPYSGNTNNFITNANLSYELFNGLRLKVNLGYNDIQLQQHNLTPISSQNPAYHPVGFSNYGNNSTNSWIIEPQAEFIKNLSRGKFSILVGGTFQQSISQNQSFFATGYTSDALLQDLLAAPQLYGASDNYAQYRYSAAFGRINYNWEDKYLINLTGRRDGSSRFGPGKQFADFGAIGAGWIFSKENFIQNLLPFLSYGKLRVSYGSTGSDQIGDYNYLSTYSATSFPYNGTTGLVLTSLTNPDYAWELTKKFDLALEFGFLKDRILFVSEFYKNRSSNQLVGYPLPVITGQSSIEANLPATVENSGWEFQLNTVNIKTNNFTWATSVNLTIPRNKLIAYPNLDESAYANTYVVGKSIYIKPLFHYVGLNDTSGQYEFSSTQGLTFNPSYPQDLHGLKQVAQNYYGGMLNSVRWGSWQLDIFVQFVKQTGLNYISFFQPPGTFANQPGLVLNRWQKPGDIAENEQFSANYGSNAGTAYSNYQNSDALISDASFIRLKNLSLSYQLPAIWTSKMKLQGIRIYLHMQDFITITKYLGMDPENQSFSSIPPLKMLTAGVQITL